MPFSRSVIHAGETAKRSLNKLKAPRVFAALGAPSLRQPKQRLAVNQQNGREWPISDGSDGRCSLGAGAFCSRGHRGPLEAGRSCSDGRGASAAAGQPLIFPDCPSAETGRFHHDAGDSNAGDPTLCDDHNIGVAAGPDSAAAGSEDIVCAADRDCADRTDTSGSRRDSCRHLAGRTIRRPASLRLPERRDPNPAKITLRDFSSDTSNGRSACSCSLPHKTTAQGRRAFDRTYGAFPYVSPAAAQHTGPSRPCTAAVASR